MRSPPVLPVLAAFATLGAPAATFSAGSNRQSNRLVVPTSSLRLGVVGGHRPRSPFDGSSAKLARVGTPRSRDGTSRGRTSLGADTASSLDVVSDGTSAYYERLLSRFRGDFDNYEQVVNDRRNGLSSGEGGGHEHIHCTLVPCPRGEDGQKMDQWVLAVFYLDGNPKQIFRSRAYHLTPPSTDGSPARLRLHSLLPGLEGELRRCSERPCSWWKEAWKVWRSSDGLNDGTTSDEGWETFRSSGISTLVSPLEGCDVLWDPKWDSSKHAYLYVDEYADVRTKNSSPSESTHTTPPPDEAFHATMEAGPEGTIVDSISMIPGKRILIKDELSLWGDEFWINDRGYDPDAELEGDAMPFVYGNRRGVPYKLRRVSDIRSDSKLLLERTVVDADLAWTLGDDFRSLDLYEERMRALAALGNIC